MLALDPQRNRQIPTERIKAASIALLFQALLAWALISGLQVRTQAIFREPLHLIGILPDKPPPPKKKEIPPPAPSRKPAGASAPPALKARATPIVAPRPPIPMPRPPVVAAPVRGTGAAPSQGAAPVPGPGTGAGGQGNGTGSGRGGNGEGGGGRVAKAAEYLKGAIKDKDYPKGAAETGAEGRVDVRFTVGTDGRASGCAVTRSSGNAELDSTTCRLIEQRYRYRPALDAEGRAVASTDTDWYAWVIPRDGERAPSD